MSLDELRAKSWHLIAAAHDEGLRAGLVAGASALETVACVVPSSMTKTKILADAKQRAAVLRRKAETL